MKKKFVEKPISDYFRKLAQKSWEVRKAKLLKVAQDTPAKEENKN